MAKNYEYKKATIADIDELVRTRIIVLRTANKLSNDVDMSLFQNIEGEVVGSGFHHSDSYVTIIKQHGKYLMNNYHLLRRLHILQNLLCQAFLSFPSLPEMQWGFSL